MGFVLHYGSARGDGTTDAHFLDFVRQSVQQTHDLSGRSSGRDARDKYTTVVDRRTYTYESKLWMELHKRRELVHYQKILTQLPRRTDHIVVEHPYGVARLRFGRIHSEGIPAQIEPALHCVTSLPRQKNLQRYKYISYRYNRYNIV